VSAGRSLSVALGIAKRGILKLLKNPPRALPPLLIPLFMFIAFTGALSAIATTKGFDYYSYTAFQFVFLLYVASMFVGVFTAFDIAHDYESGMGSRLMLATPRRMAIVAGYALYALGRALFTIAVVWGLVLAIRMPVRGDALELAGLVALALLLSLATTLYGAGVALRLQSTAAGTLIFIPVFMLLFLTPVFAPRERLTGWLRTATDLNPLTPAVEAGRGLLAGDPVRVVTAFATAAGLALLAAGWAVRGMRKAERGPGAGRSRPAHGPFARAAPR
jgi:ABC-2 type transport system permease protein